ncbi:proline--tRNA ligase [Candidatus Magnetaquicoccus inordinatus]|uniref:proline--tRNA ligase n=1 Tax=Candidatus Magnetaquicoccus inordinatus TaxID=2496818 RepID=UPI00102AF7C6|nr:proline--tRNA ligase [Candidatus Magnetaquicoccus inordinatus]
MRFQHTLIPTLKEDPVDAQVVSHRLMLRAGLIRPLGSGIYTWLPLGLRVLRKVEAIVRQEMDLAGAQEVLMPAVQPAELWQESGRWDFYGKELLRFQDRHDRPCCFGPTHEEVISDLVRREIRSYRQLPANFYQIQTKFRDEIRPRFGIMRGREFLMKDAYSFDLDAAGLDVSYQAMFAAYQRIFQRCGLAFRAVEADTGSIGGASSHEFHVLADSGEDVIISCDSCDYAANLEKAVAADPEPQEGEPPAAMEKISTPGQKSIEEVARFLKLPMERLVKSLLVETPAGPVLLLVRGDRTLNMIKAAHALNLPQVTIPDADRAAYWAGVSMGSIGPVGSRLPVVADNELRHLRNFACGANEEGWHLLHVNWQRDLPVPSFADLRNVQAGEACARCGSGRLQRHQGIEVGHVFKLGDKYSKAMGVKVLDSQGNEQTLVMGCYGIGVSRIVAAAIEQNHDANGIRWPASLAPFALQLLLLNPRDSNEVAFAEQLYHDFRAAGVEVLLDDRDERAGVKFKDADLLGCPLRLLVGGRSFKEGLLELQFRSGEPTQRLPLAEAVAAVLSLLQQSSLPGRGV